jgi:F-type H+-transporting ATPase subunit b
MLFATLLARVEEAPPPLIDVDGTFFLQLGLFILMWIALSALLFRPYLKMRAERDKGIGGARDEAHKMEQRASAIVTDYEGKLTRAKLRGQEERARLRSEAAARERQILGQARDESQRAVDAAKTKVAADADTARKELDAKARELAKTMAKKILGREVAA